jgi:tRNA dimethylallyltransferase
LAGSPNILAIIGPTACGKSALAEAIAHQLGADILSADSMQVYRGMDIGTAKPSAEVRRVVPHHLIDVAEPTEDFSVARFVELADAALRDAVARSKPTIISGGTPLYFKALFEGIFAGPSADPVVRERLAAQSSEQLHTTLQQIDPDSARRIHTNDRRRLIRAIEVFEATGTPITSLQSDWSSGSMRHEALWFGLAWSKDELNRRINQRVRDMITCGWVEEVRALVQKHGDLSRSASQAAGYEQILEHVRGKLSLDDAVEQIKIATRQLARRQIKWFRRFPNVTWLEGQSGLEEQVRAVVEVWNRHRTNL